MTQSLPPFPTQAPPEPIAIVGIGCRLPGGVHSPRDFWDLLREGREALSEVPHDRWDLLNHFDPDPRVPLKQHVRRGGFLEAIDAFDASFFGISPREAVCMDPQQRLLLEVAWQALEDGGQPLEDLRGQPVGVFMGISSSDYRGLLWASPENYAVPDNEPFVLPGNAGSIAANRLSYFFDFKGPSFTVDTACSSSLVAVHLACESLWRGESVAALAGGVQALIHPGIQMSFCKAGLLAPDGRCKSFDASADGYVRSEGAGVVLLKPLSAALANGDPIVALIRGTAVNSDGRSSGMVAPNFRSQVACVRQAFQRAGIDPAATQYVEAHGTGTRQGDPIELRALGTVLGEGRADDRPCRVGSVKTNLGHSETAAGITGLIKAALCVRHRQLPASLNFRTPNPSIDFVGLKLAVQTDLEPFPRADQPAVVGVSSFGFGGTNAHVVLTESPQPPPPPRYGQQLPLQLLGLSARTDGALRQQASRLALLLRDQSNLTLADVAASANQRRTQLGRRMVCLALDRAQLLEQLEAFAAGHDHGGVIAGSASRRPGKVAFLFTGQGSQALGMAQGLYERHPVFRAAFEACARLVDPQLPQPLARVLYPQEGQEEAAARSLNLTQFTQPALFVVGYALSQLWQSWGIRPDLVMGHSVGEVLAAHLAGVLNLEDSLRLVVARGRLMQELPGGGGMLALLAPSEVVESLLLEHPELTVAASNGPANTVVSGPREALDRLQRQAEDRALACQRLAVSHAFHSPAMAPMLAAFERELRQLRFQPPSRPLVSNLTGRLAGPEIAQPDYWCEHVMSPVRFAQGMETLASQGVQTFVEVGSRPTLIGMGRQCLQEPGLAWHPSLRSGQDDAAVILTSLAQLHLSGHRVDWKAFHQPFPHRFVELPGYPFQRQRFWWPSLKEGEGEGQAHLWLDQIQPDQAVGAATAGLEPANAAALAAGPDATHAATTAAGLQHLDLPGGRDQRYALELPLALGGDLVDHRINGQPVFPAAGFLMAALEALALEERPLALRDLQLDQPLRLTAKGAELQLVLGAALEFHGRGTAQGPWILHGGCTAGAAGDRPWPTAEPSAAAEALDPESFYDALAGFGLAYGPAYRGLIRLRREGERAWAELERPVGAPDRCLLDACFQAVAATLDPAARAGQVLLPVGLESMELEGQSLPDRFSCQVVLRPSEEPAFVRADLLLLEGDRPFGHVRGFRLRRLPRQALEWLFPAPAGADPDPQEGAESLLRLRWQPMPTADQAPPLDLNGDLWLLGGQRPASRALEAWVEGAGHRVKALPTGGVVSGPGPVVIWPELESSDPQEAVEALLAVAQQLGNGPPRPVWLVLEGEGPAQGALEAFAKTAALEQGQLTWTRLHLEGTTEQAPRPCDWPLLWAQAALEPALAWRQGRLHRQRLEPLPAERFRLAIGTYGQLESLAAVPLPPLRLGPGELEVQVEAAGLNFRDVLNALGLLRAFSRELGLEGEVRVPFGGECVGRVMAVGEGVRSDLIGQRVVAALAVGSLASHVRCRADLVLPLPEALSATEGAGLTTAYLTAIHGLEELARLKAGETVLIHAAAGGVGQAAVQVARRCGARILATASASKQAGLLDQGVEAVFDSRSLAFADAVLAHTGGRGVDVVLNSLKGDWVEAGFRALAPAGRFVELGKIETWSRAEATARRPDAAYFPFDLLEVAAAEPLRLRASLERLLADRLAGRLPALPTEVVPFDQSVEAFRRMAQARHLGKVVIALPPRPEPHRIRPDGTYVVTGGLGGIGSQLIGWLADQGATSLLLPVRSTSGLSAAAAASLGQLEQRGVKAQLLALDLSDPEGWEVLAAAAAALPLPVRGFFHAAGRLDDGLISSQSAERLGRLLGPKWVGWRTLERGLAGQPVEFGVAFSSMASLLGSPGQSCYAAANGALDGACGVARGARLAIQWGPWQGAGMAGTLTDRDRQRLAVHGVGTLSPDRAFEALERLLHRGECGSAAVVANDWPVMARQSGPRLAAPLAAFLSAAAGDAGGSDAPLNRRNELIERIAPLSATARTLLLVELVQGQLARVMGLGDGESLDAGESLFHLGLDSLMAVEFASLIHAELGVKLELSALAGEPTITSLAELVLASLQDPSVAAAGTGVLDLGREAELPADAHPAAGALSSLGEGPGEAVLLTGATGFLGAYLLADQLQRWPDLRVRCLVRAADGEAALERVRTNLERYGLWQAAWADRLDGVPGDLAQPRFGLAPERFAALAAGLGGILHNGAQLSQMAPYSQLRASNVLGTIEVLRLASLDRPVPVQFISSVAVFEGRAYLDRLILETDPLPEWRGIELGYSQTKWVSERLVLEAGRQGLPVSVYRPPLIGGHSRSGTWHQDDLLYRLFHGCLALGMAPDLAWELDLVPVDYVVEAVGALAWQSAHAGRCFHLQHPEPVFLTDLLQEMIGQGAPLSLVPMEEWLEALEGQPTNPLYPIQSLFSRRWGDDQLTYPELNCHGVRARPSCALTLAALEPLGVRCPSFAELVGPYARAFLAAPPAPMASP